MLCAASGHRAQVTGNRQNLCRERPDTQVCNHPQLYFFRMKQGSLVLLPVTRPLLPVKSDDHSGVEPLLPISNRTVKRARADDSRVRPGESRSSSDTSSTTTPLTGRCRFGAAAYRHAAKIRSMNTQWRVIFKYSDWTHRIGMSMTRRGLRE